MELGEFSEFTEGSLSNELGVIVNSNGLGLEFVRGKEDAVEIVGGRVVERVRWRGFEEEAVDDLVKLRSKLLESVELFERSEEGGALGVLRIVCSEECKLESAGSVAWARDKLDEEGCCVIA